MNERSFIWLTPQKACFFENNWEQAFVMEYERERDRVCVTHVECVVEVIAILDFSNNISKWTKWTKWNEMSKEILALKKDLEIRW
jgi:hypothetical protein